MYLSYITCEICFNVGRCPKLEPIDKKLCNACLHHHYVYRVYVLKEINSNGWWKYRVRIVDVSLAFCVSMLAGLLSSVSNFNK